MLPKTPLGKYESRASWICIGSAGAGVPKESTEPWVWCSNSPAISCGCSWLAAAGVLVVVLVAAVVAVGVVAVETAGMCREGGHGWAVKKGVGCMLQGHLVPDLEERKAKQGWYLGERSHDSLPGVGVGSGGGDGSWYSLLYCIQIVLAAVQKGASFQKERGKRAAG